MTIFVIIYIYVIIGVLTTFVWVHNRDYDYNFYWPTFIWWPIYLIRGLYRSFIKAIRD